MHDDMRDKRVQRNNSTACDQADKIHEAQRNSRPAGINNAVATGYSTVDNRQSGPRPEPRLLHQAALEALTNSARTDSPRRIGRNEFRRLEAAAAAEAACVWRGGRRLALGLGLM
ncbi:hypothetical protein F511_21456 [Dorcoceras hygrometricum]|uniref:Uncharacterized protein n=1 Tax=Dorcoceras hygrometricum TaxID=472368 RepID=A0A2Z7CNT8_9LAMI|nr:hypothetical protein F511_21456 [Dorcoceras hygrometricum]